MRPEICFFGLLLLWEFPPPPGCNLSVFRTATVSPPFFYPPSAGFLACEPPSCEGSTCPGLFLHFFIRCDAGVACVVSIFFSSRLRSAAVRLHGSFVSSVPWNVNFCVGGVLLFGNPSCPVRKGAHAPSHRFSSTDVLA